MNEIELDVLETRLDHVEAHVKDTRLKGIIDETFVCMSESVLDDLVTIADKSTKVTDAELVQFRSRVATMLKNIKVVS